MSQYCACEVFTPSFSVQLLSFLSFFVEKTPPKISGWNCRTRFYSQNTRLRNFQEQKIILRVVILKSHFKRGTENWSINSLAKLQRNKSPAIMTRSRLSDPKQKSLDLKSSCLHHNCQVWSWSAVRAAPDFTKLLPTISVTELCSHEVEKNFHGKDTKDMTRQLHSRLGLL